MSKLADFIGQKVRVRHPRYSGIGVLSRVDDARGAIAWVTLGHGEDRWYEASTVLPLNYTQVPVECHAAAPDPRQAAAESLAAALKRCAIAFDALYPSTLIIRRDSEHENEEIAVSVLLADMRAALAQWDKLK